MSRDARGWRVAILPDSLTNPPQEHRTALPDVLGMLEASGYGILQLPPPGQHPRLLAVIADQLAEYAHHGYALLAIGIRAEPADGLHWRRLAPLLRHRDVALPPRHLIRPDRGVEHETAKLSALLASYDLPAEEQRRWRV